MVLHKLFKSPLTSNIFKLLLGYPFNETLSWDKNGLSHFVLINRQSGVVTEIETEPFICLHSVNAFERGNEVILDLVCHHEGNPYDSLYLSNLTAEKPSYNPINLQRHVINVQTKKSHHTVFIDQAVEFPQINYSKVNGKNYQFAYMALMTEKHQTTFNAIQKINVITGHLQRWQKTGYYPGEPIFVSKPSSAGEDDGILLFIAFNATTQRSSLIILNAQSMQQMAEIFLPFHLPMGLHGQFYKAFAG